VEKTRVGGNVRLVSSAGGKRKRDVSCNREKNFSNRGSTTVSTVAKRHAQGRQGIPICRSLKKSLVTKGGEGDTGNGGKEATESATNKLDAKKLQWDVSQLALCQGRSDGSKNRKGGR